MARWRDVVAAVPELASRVQARFDASGLGLLATVRADGSPRVSGVEPLFAAGELWLGMMDGSRKAIDLRRDPRFALHAATVDTDVADGDAKLAGRAVEVDDAAVTAAFVADFAAATGNPPPPGPFHLFRGDIAEISAMSPAGDHLVIEWWHEDTGAHRLDRY